MADPRVGDSMEPTNPKVTRIKATYYPLPQPKPPMARRMTLVERIKRAAGAK